MLHVLLVEDNPGDVLLVREAIRTSAVQADVLVAYDGEQALRFLDELSFKPDLILLDLNLPKLSGFQILERHRNREGAPVIVFTSSSNPTDKERALELGAVKYVEKPMELSTYIATVRRALESWVGNNGSAASQ